MRLHQLSVTAFGPFAETVTIDFDRLSEAGLFLLTGDTGSGKTSILDAVCFALYGNVPGDRASAKRLRSDQADPFAQPLVELELTVTGRIFKISRSPAWRRPKKRGVGDTSIPAKVSFSEKVGAEWRFLSSRIDEVGDLISALVGLTMSQFVQVAMLPQGKFQTFLRARYDERHKLLQHLFGTDRFEQMEQWLRGERLAATRASDAANDRVAQLLGRASEVAGEPVPEEWDLGRLYGPALDAEIDRWAATLRARTERTRQTLAAEATRCQVELDQVQQLHQAATSVAALQAEASEAQEQLGQSATVEERITQIGAELELAERAGQVSAWIEAQTQAHTVAVKATRTVSQQLAALRVALDAPLTEEQLPQVERALADREADLRSCLPLVERRQQLTLELQGAHEVTAQHAERLATLQQAKSRLPGQLETAIEQHRLAQTASRRLPQQTLRVQDLTRRAEAWARVDQLAPALTAAESELFEAKTSLQLAREEWLELREQRLDGMAAEMASQLAVGCACPVCGSSEHPQPAASDRPSVDSSREKTARALVDDHEAHTAVYADAVHNLKLQLELERGRAGEQRPHPEEHRTARQELDELTQLANQEAALAAAVETVRAEVAQLDRQLIASTHDLAAAQKRGQELSQECRGVELQLADRVREGMDPGEQASECALLAEEVRRTLAAVTEVDRALAAAAAADEQVLAACALQGFADVEEALHASRSEEQRRALHLERESLRGELRAWRAVLERSDVRAALKLDPPRLSELEDQLRNVTASYEAARQRAEVSARASRRFGELADRLVDELAAWQPALADLHELSELCSFVEGKSPDNRLQMRLSAYVLAYRLSQVVDAANSRLRGMSDHRYVLEHTARRGAGETRGGLSLAVRDEWTGEARDPATLSGGETFVVALALALGLADVITAEAGGTDLETLFVDEGFGSLDSATLDHVLDTLDSLRDGGRVVGVVSHVPEMRDRIPAHLAVAKGRAGSTVSLRLS